MCVEHRPTGWLNAHYICMLCVPCMYIMSPCYGDTYIDTVIVIAEHVSIDRNPSETGFLRLLLFGKMEQITCMH